MTLLLDGKVAIVTGSGNGIGRAHAHYLAGLGARVVVNDVGGNRDGTQTGDAKPADAVVAEIKAAGGQAVASYDSVATVEGAQAIVWTAMNRFGRLDVLVNNAGILRDKTMLNMSQRELDLVLDVHLRGTFFCTQAAARQMKLAGHGGRIINTTSLSGLLGNFGQANYSAAKAGVYGLTRTASLELAKANVTVNAIAPVALTRMTRDLPVLSGASEEDLGPQHIPPIVAYLASDLAAGITGRIFGVQGHKLFEYRMQMSEGAEDKEGWTPERIHARLAEIEK